MSQFYNTPHPAPLRSILHRWLLALMVPICLLSSGVLHGQTVTSNGTASYNGGNGVGAGGGITFTVENLSGGDILITDLEAYWQTGQNGVIPTLRVRNVGASGSYAPFVAGDWTTIAVGSAVAVPANGYYPTLSGLSYLLPNGTAKQFMLEGSNGIRYSGTGAITPNSFTTAGVSIRNGDYQIASLNVGYGGIVSGTANTPRYFTGGITFMPAAACTGIPTAGAISGSSQVCTGGSTTLSVVGSSVGTGITRNWFSSLVSGGPYTTPVGSGLSVNSGAITANTYFVCEVTCTNSGQTATTSEFLVSPIGASPGGTYTIDNTLPSGGSNFNNFTDAINTLNSLGLCGAFTGPWVFNVVAGQTFNENPPQVTASGDAVNTITFQRSGAGANPVVTPTGGGGTTDFGLGIRGGNYITFDGIDIDGGSAVEFGYYIANVSATVSSNNNTIQNCTIHLDRTNTASRGIICTSSTTGGGFTPTAASGSNSNNHFFNFTIEDVYAGIFVTSGTTLWPGIGNIAGTTGGGNSTIGAAYVGTPPGDLGGTATATWGVQFLNQVDVQIFDITVQNITGTGINRGIWFGGAGGNSVVHGNRVRGIRNTSTTGTSAQRGIDVGQLTTGTHSLRVYNNFVSDITAAHATTATATRVVQGIFTSNGAAGMTYEIDFNSVALDGLGSSSASNACLEFSVATSVNIARNNSLANFTGAQAGVAVHFAIRTAGTTTLGAAGSLSDYNNLYVANATNGFAGQTATVNHPNIADWTAALSGTPGTDANSISADPIYFDNNLDLHASGPALDGAGLPGGLAWVTVDIDGDTRNDPPDIGGDEFAPASCFPPTDVAVVVNSTSTATITWTNVAALNYDWEVRSSGAPGSGPAGLEDSGNVLAAPVNLTGLPSATVFAAYVRCNCTGPLTSNWSAAVAFETPGLVGTFPYCEDFESATLCVPSTCLAGLACTSSSLDPVLWENATTDGLAEWSVDEGGTSSTGTGPGTGAGTGQPDYFPGTITGNYLYIESGVPCNGVEAIALSPVFDISSFTNPNVRAQMAYNMFGATMGTMSIDIEDPALSGTWTTLWTLSGDQGQGWFLTPTLDHVYSGTQVRYRVRGLSGSNFTSDMAFDYFCVSEGPLCTTPIASVTAVTANCLTNTMSIDVNVTSLGDATSVTVQYSVNAGPYLTACNLVAPGPCSITGLSTTAVVNVQVVHDQDNVCSIDLGNYALNDLTCITCGDPAVVENYCYVASDDKSWHYVASGGGTLKLKFNRGTLESNAFDDLTIYDGPDNTYPILFANPANTGNLGPAGSAILNTDPDFFAVDVTATGADLFMTLTTDGSVQCATSTTYDPWEWEVLCLNCIQPSVSTSIVEDCFGGSFTVEVTVSNTGDGATVDLESVPGSVEHNDVPASATPYVMGPYLNGSTVNIFVRHENDATCDLDLGTFESTCPPIIDTYPYCEDFESANLCVPSTCVAVLACTSTALDPVGWQNSTTDGSGQWSVDEGGTSSTSTGPGTGAGTGQPDYVPGTSTGNYVYMESGSCAGNTIEALSPIFDVSVFPNPAIRARMAYNMFGATMGTLAIDIEDPALSNNWTNLWSLSGDQGQGWFLTPNLDHVYTGTAVRYRVRGVSGTSFTSDMAFDYFCVRPTPLCFDPIASVTSVVPDCNAGTLTLDVDVTSLGDATTVTVEYALNGGSYVPGCVLGAPGICQIVAGAADVVSVRVVHNQDGDCGLDLGDHDSGGVYCITCGAPVVQSTYCYVADDNQSWLYESNGGGTLLLEFIRGTLETNSFDDLTIYDGPDNTYPILFANPANTGNLGPAGSAILNTDPDFFAVNVTATGNSLYMTLTTDGSVQCATSTTYDPWVWEVVCLDCSYPVATAAVVNDCPNAQYFVSVDITDAGSGGMVDIVSNLNGLEANDVGVGVHVVGPFANGTPVIITLVHPDNTLCNLELGSFFDCCQGTCAFPNAAVVGTNTNGPITCGSPTQALVNGTVPTGARWWTYTLPANGKVRVSSCTPPNSTNDDTFVTIHEGVCGSLVPYTGDDDGCTAFNFASDVTFIGSAGQTFHIEWDNRYNGTAHDWDLTFTACTPPANDLCASENPAASPLSIGAPLVFTGTRDCATKDGTLENIRFWDGVDEDVSGWVWESFQLTQCANVEINYCGSPLSGIVSLNMYGDCGSIFVNSQSYNFSACAPNATILFESLAPGDYYYPVLWDARRASGPYTLNVIASTPTTPCPANNTCASAIPLGCNSVTLGNTNNQFPTLPVNACPFPNSPVSGGSLWYSYTPAVDENVVVSTCGAGTLFDTRLDVYTGTCGALSCLTLADDKGGACTTRSQLEFYGQMGVTYYLVVHSATPFIDGAFEIAIGCGAACVPPVNDVCGSATGLTTYLTDNTTFFPGVPTAGDNSCAMNDPFTSCSLLANNQGMWYSFNSGPNTIHYLTLETFDQNPGLTSTTMNYTLYSGGCNGMQGVSTAGCVINGDGDYVLLPSLTPNTPYLIYLYNQGDAGFEGTFDVLLEHPGMNDAGIIDVNAPIGLVCTSLLEPKVILKNYGENTLTSVTITYDLDGVTGPFSYVWTGTLPFLASEEVSLPGFTAPYGNHIFNVATSLPNGQPDQIPDNDAFAEPGVNVTGETVIVEIFTDNDPSQLIWQIYDSGNQLVGVSPVYGMPNVLVPSELCLSTLNGNCFNFFLFDFLGDGLSQTGNGNGYWRLRTESGADLMRDNFDGTVDGIFSPTVAPMSAWYTNGHPFCLPAGPTEPLPSECGIFTNNLQSKVYCKAIAGVTNYQFQFLRPDEGYSRQISVPRNWVKFGEMQTFPLLPGEVYFCRVRADQAPFGNYSTDKYGTGCEMGIDPLLVPGCTGLVDDIGTPAHSCGVIKVFGGSAKIWAQPVIGATQYRFRFQNGMIDPDGPNLPQPPALGTRIITVASYALVLNWTNFTLVNGSTYDVTIEALVAGQWSGYCGPICQVEIDNTPGQSLRAMEASTSSDLQVWPNPVRDGQVNVLIGGITDDTQRITLDVFDIYGKRVMAFDKENSGSVFNTILDMDGLAAGVYMVSVTVNDRVYQQRVSVL